MAVETHRESQPVVALQSPKIVFIGPVFLEVDVQHDTQLGAWFAVFEPRCGCRLTVSNNQRMAFRPCRRFTLLRQFLNDCFGNRIGATFVLLQ